MTVRAARLARNRVKEQVRSYLSSCRAITIRWIWLVPS